MKKTPENPGTANAVALNGIFSDFVNKYQLLSALVIVAVGVLHPHAHALYDEATLGAFLAILLVIGLDSGLSLRKRLPASLSFVMPYSVVLYVIFHMVWLTDGAYIWLLTVVPLLFIRLGARHAQILCCITFPGAAYLQHQVWNSDIVVISRLIGSGLFLTISFAYLTDKFVNLINELTESQKDLSTSLEAMGHGLIVVDKNKTIKLFNSQVCKLLNIPSSMFEARPTLQQVVDFQVARGDFGEDFSRVQKEARAYIKGITHNDGGSPPTKYKRRTEAGQYLEVDSWFTKDGDKVRTYTDVTEYELTNQQLTQVLQEYAELRRRDNQRQRENLIDALSRLSMFRDNETGKHIERTQLFVRILAKRLLADGLFVDQLSNDSIHMIVKATPMHDLGKIGIPDQILLKPGRHTPEEMQIMKTHASIGESTLLVAASEGASESDLLILAARIAGAHHENWDGSGYPRGLVADAIPLPARLMAIADVYDALTTSRVYKRAWTHEEAYAEIESLSGIKFDPRIVNAFEKSQAEFMEVARNIRDNHH
jgi:response regulator RpfG family c-di-GMP phosphodiesterase